MADDVDENDKKNPDFVTALQRGLSVIEAFTADTPEMTLSEIAAVTDLSPATVRRSLTTLVELGYVGRTKRRFVLKPKVLMLGSAFLQSMSTTRVLEPSLTDLVEQFGGSSSITVLSGQDIIYVAHASANRRIRLSAGVGSHYPAFATAMGRVLMSGLPADQLQDFIGKIEFVQFTDKTVVNPERLRGIVDKVRSDGFSVVRDELDYGLISLAVPIQSRDRRLIAAVNSSDVSSRYTRESILAERLAPLRTCADRLETALADFPALIDSVLSG